MHAAARCLGIFYVCITESPKDETLNSMYLMNASITNMMHISTQLPCPES